MVASPANNYDIVLIDHLTKVNRNSIRPDRLFHHRMISTKQVNPIVSPFIWDNCRPLDRRPNANDPGGAEDIAVVWKDSYDLVCNHSRESPPIVVNQLEEAWWNCSATATTFASAVTGGKLSELQVLSMAMLIRGHGGGDYRDYAYADKSNCKSTHFLQQHGYSLCSPTFPFPNTFSALFSQPCMLIKTFYFRLLDALNEHVVEEVSLEEAIWARKLGNICGGGRIVIAHEVVFDCKGKQGCNHSV